MTAALVYAGYLMSSNHLVGTSTERASLTLTSNATSPAVTGDFFILVAHISDGSSGVLVTFYDTGQPIGAVTTNGTGHASLGFVENNLSWDIWCEATHP